VRLHEARRVRTDRLAICVKPQLPGTEAARRIVVVLHTAPDLAMRVREKLIAVYDRRRVELCVGIVRQ
jgi:hypothetical protein